MQLRGFCNRIQIQDKELKYLHLSSTFPPYKDYCTEGMDRLLVYPMKQNHSLDKRCTHKNILPFFDLRPAIFPLQASFGHLIPKSIGLVNLQSG